MYYVPALQHGYNICTIYLTIIRAFNLKISLPMIWLRLLSLDNAAVGRNQDFPLKSWYSQQVLEWWPLIKPELLVEVERKKGFQLCSVLFYLRKSADGGKVSIMWDRKLYLSSHSIKNVTWAGAGIPELWVQWPKSKRDLWYCLNKWIWVCFQTKVLKGSLLSPKPGKQLLNSEVVGLGSPHMFSLYFHECAWRGSTEGQRYCTYSK